MDRKKLASSIDIETHNQSDSLTCRFKLHECAVFKNANSLGGRIVNSSHGQGVCHNFSEMNNLILSCCDNLNSPCIIIVLRHTNFDNSGNKFAIIILIFRDDIREASSNPLSIGILESSSPFSLILTVIVIANVFAAPVSESSIILVLKVTLSPEGNSSQVRIVLFESGNKISF